MLSHHPQKLACTGLECINELMDIAWTAVVLVTLLVGGVAGAGYLLHPGTQSSGSSAHFVPLVQLRCGP